MSRMEKRRDYWDPKGRKSKAERIIPILIRLKWKDRFRVEKRSEKLNSLIIESRTFLNTSPYNEIIKMNYGRSRERLCACCFRFIKSADKLNNKSQWWGTHIKRGCISRRKNRGNIVGNRNGFSAGKINPRIPETYCRKSSRLDCGDKFYPRPHLICIRCLFSRRSKSKRSSRLIFRLAGNRNVPTLVALW